MALVKWRIIFAVYFGLVWMYAVALCCAGVRSAWREGHGRVRSLVQGVLDFPACAPAVPLLLLPLLACRITCSPAPRHLILLALSLLTLALSTMVGSLTLAVLQERSLLGLQTTLLQDLRLHYGHESSSNLQGTVFTQGMDYVQYTFHCCGILGDTDYEMTKWHKVGTESGLQRLVPPSCCVPEIALNNITHSGSPVNVVSRVFYGMLEEGWQKPQPKHESSCKSPDQAVHSKARYKNGCIKFIEVWMREDIVVFLVLGGSLIILEVFGIFLSLFLRSKTLVQVDDDNET